MPQISLQLLAETTQHGQQAQHTPTASKGPLHPLTAPHYLSSPFATPTHLGLYVEGDAVREEAVQLKGLHAVLQGLLAGWHFIGVTGVNTQLILQHGPLHSGAQLLPHLLQQGPGTVLGAAGFSLLVLT